MTRYALRFRDGTIQVRRVTDDQEIARFQARGDREYLGLRLQPRRPLPGDHAFSRPCPDGLGHRPRHSRPERSGPDIVGRAAKFSPDSRRIGIGHQRIGNSSSTTWRPVGPVRSLRVPMPPANLAFRPDGAQIAVRHER